MLKWTKINDKKIVIESDELIVVASARNANAKSFLLVGICGDLTGAPDIYKFRFEQEDNNQSLRQCTRAGIEDCDKKCPHREKHIRASGVCSDRTFTCTATALLCECRIVEEKGVLK